MLNPSTADASNDDPTIRRCKGFAQAWACGRLVVVNLFAFRATKPADMKRADDPVGPDNDAHIARAALEVSRSGGHLVCAWGAHGKIKDRGRKVLADLLAQDGAAPCSLDLTADGMPRHPLYLRGDLLPVPYRGAP